MWCVREALDWCELWFCIARSSVTLFWVPNHNEATSCGRESRGHPHPERKGERKERGSTNVMRWWHLYPFLAYGKRHVEPRPSLFFAEQVGR